MPSPKIHPETTTKVAGEVAGNDKLTLAQEVLESTRGGRRTGGRRIEYFDENKELSDFRKAVSAASQEGTWTYYEKYKKNQNAVTNAFSESILNQAFLIPDYKSLVSNHKKSNKIAPEPSVGIASDESISEISTEVDEWDWDEGSTVSNDSSSSKATAILDASPQPKQTEPEKAQKSNSKTVKFEKIPDVLKDLIVMLQKEEQTEDIQKVIKELTTRKKAIEDLIALAKDPRTSTEKLYDRSLLTAGLLIAPIGFGVWLGTTIAIPVIAVALSILVAIGTTICVGLEYCNRQFGQTSQALSTHFGNKRANAAFENAAEFRGNLATYAKKDSPPIPEKLQNLLDSTSSLTFIFDVTKEKKTKEGLREEITTFNSNAAVNTRPKTSDNKRREIDTQVGKLLNTSDTDDVIGIHMHNRKLYEKDQTPSQRIQLLEGWKQELIKAREDLISTLSEVNTAKNPLTETQLKSCKMMNDCLSSDIKDLNDAIITEMKKTPKTAFETGVKIERQVIEKGVELFKDVQAGFKSAVQKMKMEPNEQEQEQQEEKATFKPKRD